MANWLNKVFDSGVRKGVDLAEKRVQKEVKSATDISPKTLYSKARKEFNKGADTDDMYGENTKFPKGMVPIGDKGFYASGGDGTFDPRDCSNPRNATSPFCGYNPVSPKPLDLGIDLNINDCGGYFSIKPTLGFINLPPVYAGYLQPFCREEYKKENNKDAPPNKTVPPGLEVVPPPDNFPPTPGNNPPKLSPKCWYIVALGRIVVLPTARTQTNRGNGYLYVDSGGLNSVFPGGYSWQYSFKYSSETYYAGGSNSTNIATPTPSGEPTGDTIIRWSANTYSGTITITGDYRDDRVIKSGDNYYYTNGIAPNERRYYSDEYQGWQSLALPFSAKYEYGRGYSQTFKATMNDLREWETEGYGANLESGWMRSNYGLYPAIRDKEFNKTNNLVGGSAAYPNLFAGTGENILRYLAESNWDNSNYRAFLAQYKGMQLKDAPKVSYYILDIYDLPCDTSPSWNYPPFKEPCMPCCCNPPSNDKQRQDDEILRLLREIRKFIGDFPRKVEVYDDDPDTVERQKLEKSVPSISLGFEHFQKQINHVMQTIGIEEFPVKYPDSVVKPIAMNGVEMLWDWLTPDKERKIQSLAQLMDWGFDQMSAVQGQWHQYIEYEDKDGKKQKISFPDMGTIMRETIKMLSSTIQALGIQTDIELKTLQESTHSSLMIAEALKRITDIQDYLDYPTQQRAGSLPVQITPKKDIKNIKEYLESSELKYQWDDWTPNQGHSLQEQLNDIMMILNTMRATQGGEF